MKLSLFGVSLALGQVALAATPAQWRSRSIYQVMTDRFARTDGSTTATCNTADSVYCGGSWQGIINRLDYIQGMGFDAVWISPVTYQLQGNTAYGYAYHGYWQQNLYELNSNFGTAADLQNLAAALHARGMYLMVDVVVNHNGYNGAPSTVDYSDFYPFNQQSDYHPYCAVDYSNITSIQDCWLGDTVVPLPDLKTEASNVMSGYQTWIKELISNYSIDGLRVDTVYEVDKAFWPGFNTAASVYMVGEVDDGDAATVCGYQTSGGMMGVLNYPMYYPITAAFQTTSGSMSALASMITTMKSTAEDTSLLGSFSENWDVPRFASLNGDINAAKNVLAFTLMADGIPIVYEGQEQHYNAEGGSSTPYNREAIWFSGYNKSAVLYTLVASLNQVRNNALYADSGYSTYQNYPIYTDSSTLAMRKGTTGKQIVTVLSNAGSGGSSYTLTLGNTGFTAGQQVMEILTCKILTADSSGNLAVPMSAGLPRVYTPVSVLAGSGICGQSSKLLVKPRHRYMRPRPKLE